MSECLEFCGNFCMIEWVKDVKESIVKRDWECYWEWMFGVIIEEVKICIFV